MAIWYPPHFHPRVVKLSASFATFEGNPIVAGPAKVQSASTERLVGSATEVLAETLDESRYSRIGD